MTKTEIILTLVALLLTLVALVLTYVNIKIASSNAQLNERSEKRRGILDVFSMYSSKDVLEGTRLLYDKYRSQGEDKDKFIAYYLSEAKIKRRLRFLRRTVSHFWITFGTLLEHQMIDKKIAHQLWSQDDVGIVEEIIILLENAIAQDLKKPKLSEGHPLRYFVKNKDKFYKG